MNFSAEKASRKWPCGGSTRGEWPIVKVAAMLLMLGALTDPVAAARRLGTGAHGPWSLVRERGPEARRDVLTQPGPLPKPRPADAPVSGPEQPASSPLPPSACRLALSDEIAIAPSIPDIHG